MTALRKLLPWMASLLVHALLALAADGARAEAGVAPFRRRMVDLLFEQPEASPRTTAGGPRRETAVKRPPAVPVRTEAPRGAPLASKGPIARPAAPREPAPASSTSQPVHPVSSQSAEPPEEVQASAGAPGGTLQAPGTGTEGAQFGWVGEPRKVLRRQEVAFPRVLREAGQEVDCEARITVTPLGVVSHVEIIRSSGYTEVDSSVETALRGYLFSRDFGYGKSSAVGIVKFRFRLERID